jgi:hypothetical protein
VARLIAQTRAIGTLQHRYGVVADHSLFDDRDKRLAILRDHIQGATERLPIVAVFSLNKISLQKFLKICIKIVKNYQKYLQIVQIY